MATISRLSVSLTANANPLKRGLKRAGAMVKRFTSRIFSLKSAIVGALGGLALGKVIGESLTLFAAQEKAVTSLDASIKSMGRTTNGLSRNLQALASQIQREGILGDEVILQGASFLTTYDKITDRLLPRTIRIMADLSAKMGGDTTAAAKLLGKASMGLVGSLSIAGISLSDATKKSKDFEAILGEIEAQVGGMNAALGATSSGAMKKFQNAVGDLKEVLGGIISVAVEPFLATFTLGMLDAGKSMKQINTLGEKFRTWIVDSVKQLGFFIDAWNVLKGVLGGVRVLMNNVAIGLLKTQTTIMKFIQSLNFMGLMPIGEGLISDSAIKSASMAMDDLIKKNKKLMVQVESSGLLFENMLGVTDDGAPSDMFKLKIDDFAFQSEVDMMKSRLGLKPGGTFRQESAAVGPASGKLEVLEVPELLDTNIILRQILREQKLGTVGVAG